MAGNELVSILMPAYKAVRWLPQSIPSIQAQTYQDWELIIVEDRSPDETYELARSFAAADPRIRVLRTPTNRGPAGARIVGWEAIKGRYVAYLDADDLWMPTKLERQLADLEGTGVALSFTAFRKIDVTGERVGRLITVPRQLDHRTLLGYTAIVASSALTDRRAGGDVAPRYRYLDDFARWLDILRPGGIALGLNEDLVRYRVSPGSHSVNKFRSAWHVWDTYRVVEDLGLVESAWHLGQYAFRAAFKHSRF